jgi:prepilin-type N-terminal cleavage/methylation domain-containing protein
MLGKRGFTLIEIVMVLALAGLLLVIVFVALSGTQSSRRDAVRKQDLSRLAAQLDVYAANHDGQYPDANGNPATGFTGGFESDYLPMNFVDPLEGSTYDLNHNMGASCNRNAAMNANGPGSISYEKPGNGHPYRLRVCLEKEHFYIGN